MPVRQVSMPETEYCFIVNPAANGGLAGRNWPALQAQLRAQNIAHDYFLSKHQGHGVELAQKALQAGHKNLIVVGGDGSANEVLNGIFSATQADTSDISLGAIPWGTGNDWANYYGLSADPQHSIRLLRSGCGIRQDIGKVLFSDFAGNASSHYFLNCTGTGFDSYLLEKMGPTHGSRSRYFRYVLKCLRKFRATSLQINVDDESLESQALMLQICLGRYAGAGMRFAPAAQADDGLFEVLLVNGQLGFTQLLTSLHYLYNGKINDHPAVRHWQSHSVSVAALCEQNFHCDGELIGPLPIQVEIIPRALRIIAPRQSNGQISELSPQ